MPWSETCAMDERMRFIVAASEDEAVMSEICAEFGISRQTGYKWLGRYRAEGAEGLKERSRAPVHHGRARDEELVAAALALRERHPTWGPKKLRQKLCGRFSEEPAPARSTIGDWLRKEGLTQLRRPRRRCPPFSSPLQSVEAPNDVWCADFKGWFLTDDKQRCDPLTLNDASSRYFLRCQAVTRTDGAHVRPESLASSRSGSSRASRSRTAASSACTAPSRRRRPILRRPRSPIGQRRFDDFRAQYNHERPHEALDFATPASLYRASERSYPRTLRQPDYPDGAAVRRVRSNGGIKWGGELIFVSEALIGEPVAVEETEEGEWLVRYAHVELGFIDPTGRLRRRKLSKPRRACGLVDNAARCPQGPQADQKQQQQPDT